MLLSQWVERFGQLVAPDDNYVKPKDEISLFEIVAPLPDKQQENDEEDEATTVCIHCHKVTPIHAVESSSSPRTPSKNGKGRSSSSSAPRTRTHQLVTRVDQIRPDKQQQILQTVLETNLMAQQSEKFKETFHSLQNGIASRKIWIKDSPFLKKLQATLAKDDENVKEGHMSLRFARTSSLYANSGGTTPDGFTLLHLAAKAGQNYVIEALLENLKEEQLERTDLYGDTADLIACQYGRKETFEILKRYYPEFNTGAIGFTGYARAMTSPLNTNKDKFKDLYSPDNPNVFMSNTKAPRVDDWMPLGVTLGLVSISGKRILMEDAHQLKVWTGKDDEEVGFACICDGHGDQGHVAQFVAESLPYALMKTFKNDGVAELGESRLVELLDKACRETNEELEKKKLKGGTTATFALLTASKIVVGNVGDSRAILIQKGATKKEDLTEAMSSLSMNESESFTVTALSTDHTVESELGRLKEAGATIKKDVYKNAKSEEVTSYKLDLGSDILAMSRAFGDFEFRKLGLIESPGVVVHDRDFDRDAYLILACDGVWDHMSNEEVGRMVVEQMAAKPEINQDTLTEVAEEIARNSMPSGDNISLMILSLKDKPTSVPVPDLIPVMPGAESP
eukprot:scaffold6594_cov162-Amphora_coffeaeformis.AAC.9